MSKDTTPYGFKLQKLKELRRKKLERDLLEIHLKGCDHLVVIDEFNKASIVAKDGTWIIEHIRTAIIKYNIEIEKTFNMEVRDFSDKEIMEYEKIYE
tara:strand:- start:1182 stop:1472 length:291 start_codon:yes stop_codon:yes gene_type:complete